MQVKINNTSYALAENTTIAEAASAYKPGASVFILNGLPATGEHPLADSDELILIRLKETPGHTELEHMLSARHAPGAYDILQQRTIGIAGLGGLGSHIAAMFVRMGIGRLVGVDYDIVEPSNIGRQYYYLDQIGMEKSVALTETLKRISPFTQLELHNAKVTENNASAFFDTCDILIEAFDLSYSKIMLYETWAGQRFTKYYIGASGIAGFQNDPPITTRKIGDNVYMVGDFTTDESAGLMAARVGTAACVQASIAMQLLMEDSLP